MLFVRPTRGCTVRVIGLVMLFVRVLAEDTVGIIGLIMLFVRVPAEDTVDVIGLTTTLLLRKIISIILTHQSLLLYCILVGIALFEAAAKATTRL